VLQSLFGVAPASLGQCVAWTMLGAVPLVVLEIKKVAGRAMAPRQPRAQGKEQRRRQPEAVRAELNAEQERRQVGAEGVPGARGDR
jgi:hypothetical protein